LAEAHSPNDYYRAVLNEAWAAYRDHQRYKEFPIAGGLDDQDVEWKEQMDTLLSAKEWAEAITNARQEYERQASRDDDEFETEAAYEHLMELNETHSKIIEELRSGSVFSQ
jgi:hypothetical protein